MDGLVLKSTAALTILLLVFEMPSPVSGLDCYQCDSTLNSNCQENWNHGLKLNEESYNECKLWDAKFCVKVTGMWGGVVGTHRFCSSRDLGDQCQDIWFPDHDRKYRACVFTCTGDGCNASSRVSLNPILFASFILMIFCKYFLQSL